jgi:hypothetical protein
LLVSDFLDMASIEPFVRACAARFETTALLARDPWHAELPLSGFVRLRDAENGASARAFVGKRERALYHEAVARREAEILGRLYACGLRVGTFDEATVDDALFEAFGLAA